jgi:hypothetical protein
MKELIEDLDALYELLTKFRSEMNSLQNLSVEQIDEINSTEHPGGINPINAAFDRREAIMRDISVINDRFNKNAEKHPPELIKLIRGAFSGRMLHFPTDRDEKALCDKIRNVCSLRSDILRGDKIVAHKLKQRYAELHELLASGTDTKKKIKFYSAYAASTPSYKSGKGGNMDNNA